MAHDRRKQDRRKSASVIGKENLQAAEKLVQRTGGRLNIADALSRVQTARTNKDERQAKRNK